MTIAPVRLSHRPTLADAATLPLIADDARNGIRVERVRDLDAATRRSMRALLSEYYDGVTAERFERDLAEKEWVVLCRDPRDGALWGFSTLMRLAADIDGERVLAFYSGDTVTRADRWGQETTAAIRHLLRHIFDVGARTAADRTFWFMISSTYRSYRVLSLLFREFEPGPDRPLTARGARIMGALSALKGFTEYDARRSVVRFEQPTIYRGPDSSDARDGAAGVDPSLAFFAAANPHASRGDRLASLTELTVANLSPTGRRLLAPRDDAP